MNTYISLFSSAGVGCYGFKMEDFECIATNELIERRLNVQKHNRKCKYESGYICGDITQDETKQLLYNQIKLWRKQENLKRVDVVIATPPCQGMSVANHKKNDKEIIRNSLVVESIKIIKEINPKFFIFENVPAFMKTICTDIDGQDKLIAEAIESNLGELYSYSSKVINFKNYGACSSRSRTVVIGVSKELADEIAPAELYPTYREETTLRKTIGHLKSLKIMGEIDEKDIYHAFREYPERMRAWICDLKEGESAFDNEDDNKKPHQVVDGKIIINQRKNADKYTRTYWDKVGPCVHTRNDQLASQNTIHPSDDRVFSIRELMLMMTVPYDFKWSEYDLDYLNNLSLNKKKQYLKKEEIKIRQSLGEAVPTIIFREIARNIKSKLGKTKVKKNTINQLIDEYQDLSTEELIEFIKKNPLNLSISTLSKIAEMANTKRTDNGAFYTNKELITKMMETLRNSDKEEINVLEPSVGVGNFIPFIIDKFSEKKLNIDVIDVDENSIKIAKVLMEKYDIPKTVKINYIVDDFLTHKFEKHYDYIIGNPPFVKLKDSKLLRQYRKQCKNKEATNICSYFLDKTVDLADTIALVFPKFILNTPEYIQTREYLKKMNIECIIDFGEKGFPGVLIETISLYINPKNKPNKTRIISLTKNIDVIQKQNYIMDPSLPYWVIYRNEYFDKVWDKLEFDVFNVFRDRQITNSIMNNNIGYRVIKSRNINKDGTIVDIPNYDSYIEKNIASTLSVYDYLDRDDVYLTPNMTYYPRVIKKPKGVLVNGSVAILIPKTNIELTKEQCEYFSSEEYWEFYGIARNYQTRSLNVDSCSVYFYGILKQGGQNA